MEKGGKGRDILRLSLRKGGIHNSLRRSNSGARESEWGLRCVASSSVP